MLALVALLFSSPLSSLPSPPNECNFPRLPASSRIWRRGRDFPSPARAIPAFPARNPRLPAPARGFPPALARARRPPRASRRHGDDLGCKATPYARMSWRARRHGSKNARTTRCRLKNYGRGSDISYRTFEKQKSFEVRQKESYCFPYFRWV